MSLSWKNLPSKSKLSSNPKKFYIALLLQAPQWLFQLQQHVCLLAYLVYYDLKLCWSIHSLTRFYFWLILQIHVIPWQLYMKILLVLPYRWNKKRPEKLINLSGVAHSKGKIHTSKGVSLLLYGSYVQVRSCPHCICLFPVLIFSNFLTLSSMFRWATWLEKILCRDVTVKSIWSILHFLKLHAGRAV